MNLRIQEKNLDNKNKMDISRIFKNMSPKSVLLILAATTTFTITSARRQSPSLYSRHRTREPRGTNICINRSTNRHECCRGWSKRSVDDKGCKAPKCPEGCGHNGFCQRPGFCFCKDTNKVIKGPCGLGGPKECNLECNDGLCRFNQGVATCVCPPGLAGKHCEQPVCGDGCLNGGNCVGRNMCQCKYGFYGSRCEVDYRTEWCYSKTLASGRCSNQYRVGIMTKELCCNTIGHAWGNDCEPCPVHCTSEKNCGVVKQCPIGKRNTGYIGEPCEDIDECHELEGSICIDGECTNTEGSYVCRCANGYYFDKDTQQCMDVNECDTDDTLCPGFCENLLGNFRCNCPANYDLSDDGRNCIHDPFGKCFQSLDNRGQCSNVFQEMMRKSDCCCSSVAGECFDGTKCPAKSSKSYRELCDQVVDTNIPDYDWQTDANPTRGPDVDDNATYPPDSTEFDATTDYDGSGADTTELPPGVTHNDVDSTPYIPTNGCPEDQPHFCRRGTCQNDHDGLPICDCPSGLTFDTESNDCQQPEGKCAENPHLCRHGFCHSEDSKQGYVCTCESPGWKVSTPFKDTCLDVDECAESDSLCSHGSCVNTPGSYKCECQPGFERIQSGECSDIDECNIGVADCGAGICLNESPGFTCLCDQGYKLSADGKTCDDVNECAIDANLCKNGDCVNQPGSYFCKCDAGFRKITQREMNELGDFQLVSKCVDVDECSDGNPCGESRCINSAGSYSCICKPFYSNDGRTGSCTPSNYRNLINPNRPNEIVVPAMTHITANVYYESGDSSVSKCSRNIDLNDYQCNPNNTLSSPITGTDCCCALNNENEQSAWGNSCTLCPAPNSHEHQKLCSNIGPIDYCKVVKENPCGTGGKCENVHQKKTFQCKCSPGFKETDDKHDCIDVDECKLNYCKGRTNKCTNTVGSYRCGCGNGYELKNNVCADINECDDSPCKGNSVCKNSPGGFSCECQNGLEKLHPGSVTNTTCVDNKRTVCWTKKREGKCEASTNTLLTKEECCKTVGEPDCNKCNQNPTPSTPSGPKTCEKGFRFCPFKKTCIDIDECDVLQECEVGCKQNGSNDENCCKNTPGSYFCTCPDGKTLNSDGRTCSDERIGQCFMEFNGEQASGAFQGSHRKDICCCSNIGKAWQSSDNEKVETCPHSDTSQFASLCEAAWGSFTPPGSKDQEPIDINECLQFTSLCGEHGVCKNYPEGGGYECECDPGYDTDYRGLVCKDINECKINKNICGTDDENESAGTCQNLVGSFECNCFDGYKQDKRGVCVDVNECQANNVCLLGVCKNTDGDYECECPDGYALEIDLFTKPVTRNCKNKNRCLLEPGLCEHGKCIDTVDDDPGYRCDCGKGYQPINDDTQCVDVNECECSGVKICDDDAECMNLEGSYECVCPDGKELQEDNHTCKDIDECFLEPEICGPRKAGHCENTDGDYDCICNPGYEEEFITTLSGKRQTRCKDINECSAHQGICGCSEYTDSNNLVQTESIGNCTNLPGGYTCDCELGYCIDEINITCVDEDECLLGNHECHVNAECTNLVGAYNCTCAEGLFGDGMLSGSDNRVQTVGEGCVDIDECEGDNNCHMDAVCSNTFGSFNCECNEGFHGNGVNCTNIDECDKNPNLCGNGVCEDKHGSYECKCDHGFEIKLPGRQSCVDFDECARTDMCHGGNPEVAKCHNKQGSFACQCFQGYELNEEMNQCVDINECDDPLSCVKGHCANSKGGFSCSCPPHYTRVPKDRGLGYDRYECEDIREGTCFRSLDLVNESCEMNIDRLMTKTACCCADLGAGWSFENEGCEMCPLKYNDIAAAELNPDYKLLCTSLTMECEDGQNCTASHQAPQINECESFGDQACINGQCIDLEEGYTCECPKGYKLKVEEVSAGSAGRMIIMKKCLDVNECVENIDENGHPPCYPGGTCENISGDYKCKCQQPEYQPHTWRGKHSCRDERPGLCNSPEVGIGAGSGTCDAKEMSGGEDALMLSKRACCCIGNLGTSHNCTYCPVQGSDDFNKLCNNVQPTEVCNKQNNLCQGGRCSFRPGTNDLQCNCPRGFAEDTINKSCKDIDECEFHENNRCGENSTCINVSGSFHCECKRGFRQTRNGCENIDECALQAPNACKNGNCQDTIGNYQCACNPGYELSSNGHHCLDKNECEKPKQACGEVGTCMNMPGSYICSCPSGYKRVENRCVDIDECSTTRGGLCDNGDCINTDGSYFCKCSEGFEVTYDKRHCVDIDECFGKDPLESCGASDSQCANMASSYMCFCPDGFKSTNNSTHCEDINECDLDSEKCANGACVNLLGDYKCNCDSGFKPSADAHFCLYQQEGKCFRNVMKVEATTESAFTQNPNSRNKTTPESEPTGTPHQSATEPLPLNSCGFESRKSTKPQCCCQCLDNSWSDEEGEDTACRSPECPRQGTPEFKQLCPGGCGTAEHPETGEPTDIDECSQNPDNDFCLDAKCINTPRSFRCKCNRGYSMDFSMDSEAGTCIDIDECAGRNPCGNNAKTCVNTVGSYRCECETGYQPGYNSPHCVDINECTEYGNNYCNYRCINKPGTYTCGCPKGYNLNSDKVSCANVNECEEKENPCGVNHFCEDTVGSYVCRCKPGFEQVDGDCVDQNECMEGKNLCGVGSCSNHPGGYSCDCPSSYDNNENGKPGCYDNRRGTCFMKYHAGHGLQHSSTGSMVTRDECCCSGGKGWNSEEYSKNELMVAVPNVQACPAFNTKQYKKLCPHGLGFTTKGKDINECGLVPNVCQTGNKYSPHNSCVNQAPGYECVCKRGYTSSDDGHSCVDIDECGLSVSDYNRHKCGSHSTCENSPGGYSCECDAGYENYGKGGLLCIDIDECSANGEPVCERNCKNKPGSYECTCPRGWSLSGGKNCEDVDECDDQPGICGTGLCKNEVGSYYCLCEGGVLKDGYTGPCANRPVQNRCPHTCGVGRTCLENKRGKFRCRCNSKERWDRRNQRCVPRNRGRGRNVHRGGSVCGGKRCKYGCNNMKGGCHFCDYKRGYFRYGKDYCVRAASESYSQKLPNADQVCYGCKSTESVDDDEYENDVDYTAESEETAYYGETDYFRGRRNYRALPDQNIRTDLRINVEVEVAGTTDVKVFEFMPADFVKSETKQYRLMTLEDVEYEGLLYVEYYKINGSRVTRDTQLSGMSSYAVLYLKYSENLPEKMKVKLLGFEQNGLKTVPVSFELDLTIRKSL